MKPKAGETDTTKMKIRHISSPLKNIGRNIRLPATRTPNPNADIVHKRFFPLF